MSAAISLRDVEKAFVDRDGTERIVLRGFSLEVRPGELVALVGPSGAGKSTLLNLIAGLQRAERGEVRIEGSRHRSPRLSIVFQQPRLLDWLSVESNVALAADAAGIDRSATLPALEAVGLAEYRRAYPTRLSGGQRQRVAVARAFVVEPDVVLFDEPFSSLDEMTARQLRLLTQNLWLSRPRTGILVTHNPLEAALLADRIVTLAARPAKIVNDRPVPIARPRRLDDERLFRLQAEAFADLG
ncbi:MAG TPA: ATP-binding cassette domain-containing protein [Candidatus Acidoferrum sp.]|jgi:NitT/TauT family transport system ATP-binding protein|nr:ATP-binding cassette domain-containing protein [Candidatus Acidoferrum sp.]